MALAFTGRHKKDLAGTLCSKLSAPAKSLEEEALLSSFIAQGRNHVNRISSDKSSKMMYVKSLATLYDR